MSKVISVTYIYIERKFTEDLFIFGEARGGITNHRFNDESARCLKPSISYSFSFYITCYNLHMIYNLWYICLSVSLSDFDLKYVTLWRSISVVVLVYLLSSDQLLWYIRLKMFKLGAAFVYVMQWFYIYMYMSSGFYENSK